MYDIVKSALKGNVHDMATVVCHLVQLYQRKQKTPRTDISSILLKTNAIAKESQTIKSKFDGLVQDFTPKDYAICIEKQKKGVITFVNYIVSSYKSFIDHELPGKLKSKDLSCCNRRKTLVKLTRHYHPDKAKTLPNGTWSQDDIDLRILITKIIMDFKMKSCR